MMVTALPESLASGASPWVYHLYGLCLASQWSLPYPQRRARGTATVEFCEAPASFFPEASAAIGPEQDTSWCQHQVLHDGSIYLRWPGLFEFLVKSDGSRVFVRALGGASMEAFHSYLLGPTLSFALLKLGTEPLHATAFVVEGAAVGLMGECGDGKSSLGAAFVQDGHPLLTDDLLVLSEDAHGVVAHPGPPRIKLFPEIGRRLLGKMVARGTPMSPLSSKLIVPLEADQACAKAAPLKALYVLAPPATGTRLQKVTIRRASPRRGFVELLRHTFNRAMTDANRLERQFLWCARLAPRVPIKLLSYPRTLSALPAVRRAILSDLAR
jgi:hypothetical protein